jgi:hypothetical protein
MNLKTVILALVIAMVTPIFAQLPEDLKRQFDEAERRIVRVPPQDALTKKPHNVIKGAFAKPGQVDWAVLCSIKGVWTILEEIYESAFFGFHESITLR